MAMGVLLLPSPSFAQSQLCAIRQAIATHGYAAAIEVGRKGSPRSGRCTTHMGSETRSPTKEP